jgi:uncharacterized protein YdhG (YjbR/CyaY superfamily)
LLECGTQSSSFTLQIKISDIEIAGLLTIICGTIMAPKREFKSTDEYIATFPKNIQTILEEVRQAVRDAAPEAQEVISYQMPAFKQNGILVWFAAHKNHIGFYPRVSAIESFKDKLSRYEVSKGTVKFPLNEPNSI